MSWSKEQVDEFLTEKPRIGRLATASSDAEPHVVPIWFRHDGERLLIHTMRESAKARNVSETGRFSLVVDKDDPPYAGVTLTGRANVIPPESFDYATLVKDLAVEYLGADMGSQYGEMIAGSPGEHVTLELYPERWESWDYSQG